MYLKFREQALFMTILILTYSWIKIFFLSCTKEIYEQDNWKIHNSFGSNTQLKVSSKLEKGDHLELGAYDIIDANTF